MPLNADEFLAALAAMRRRVDAASKDISSRGALIVQRNVMAELRKGYGVVSGTMRRSTHTLPTTGVDGVYSTKVSPGVIYARRFDLGFAGRDSLGRVYNQKPRPYMEDGVAKSQLQVKELAYETWAAAIRG